ncbi:MAG: hypothetical protein RLZZ221_2280 [Verrucomicrobiota bacterium]
MDDVVLGCVTPVGEQGADIARIATLVAGYAQNVPGKQLNRFCASKSAAGGATSPGASAATAWR